MNHPVQAGDPQESGGGTHAHPLRGPGDVPYINRQYRRTGTLGDSRYQSSLIQAETYSRHLQA